jgi:hypothetical protein
VERHVSDDDPWQQIKNWAKGHLDYMRDHGTDVQLISPRPFQLMQSEKPARLVHWFTEECNNIIHRQMKLFPGKWIGVCALPQTAGDPIQNAIPELERCVKQLGLWVSLNPDPYKTTAPKRHPGDVTVSAHSSASWTWRTFTARLAARSLFVFHQ